MASDSAFNPLFCHPSVLLTGRCVRAARATSQDTVSAGSLISVASECCCWGSSASVGFMMQKLQSKHLNSKRIKHPVRVNQSYCRRRHSRSHKNASNTSATTAAHGILWSILRKFFQETGTSMRMACSGCMTVQSGSGFVWNRHSDQHHYWRQSAAGNGKVRSACCSSGMQTDSGT